MFCESCGTVLNVHGQCINCEKKLEGELDTEKQVDLNPDVVQ
ncbi:MAG: hypothetical protein ACFFB5_05505 [Promethearchaeota archaeon]